MEKKTLPVGIYVNKPRENAPEFIKGDIKIEVDAFIKYIQENRTGDFIRFTIKESKAGKFYPELNTWSPSQNRPEFMKKDESIEAASDEINSEEIPF